MKNLKNIRSIFGIVVLFLLVGCNKTNWNENYKEKSKDPFGIYITYNELEDLSGEKVHFLNENIYDYLFHNYTEPTKDFATYICIKNSTHKLSKDAINNLLTFVNDGNQVFLSLNKFNSILKEKLELTTVNLDTNAFGISSLKKLKGELYLENKNFKNQPYFYDRNLRKIFFEKYNSTTTAVLGNIKVNGKNQPNFIKVHYGKGIIYLHTNPIVFTNYFLLKDKDNYVENVFSYLPQTKILWDPQVKSSKFVVKKEENKESIFKFFLQYDTLTWFLFISFTGLVLFILFNARRKQRAIPIIKPLENTTVAFTQTIASLYLKEKNHKNLADKKIKFFLEKVRTKYLLNTSHLNAKFIEKLAAKSGNSIQNTKYLIHTIIEIDKKTECSEEQLTVLHKMIDNFFNK
ncbi:DUF4350 domain-containing protein [Tenacibaculum sp. IB213877]|uniref:DUF4350 domain-containing protein n=1 Tax=Tenacibaculum sp. IB213877 TaxID=3097351 RepID=UPI002A5AB9B0|nr:DUF4350 domain-containing protein [Tenacibaculum sp. IB213877]MDY0779640.1 DUF4350 domain-containing protein [Tenacibaculum sp. IB213877]